MTAITRRESERKKTSKPTAATAFLSPFSSLISPSSLSFSISLSWPVLLFDSQANSTATRRRSLLFRQQFDSVNERDDRSAVSGASRRGLLSLRLVQRRERLWEVGKGGFLLFFSDLRWKNFGFIDSPEYCSIFHASM